MAPNRKHFASDNTSDEKDLNIWGWIISFCFWIALALLTFCFSCASTWEKPTGKINFNNCVIVESPSTGDMVMKCEIESDETENQKDESKE